ncbi:EAL domain-containing protein [Pseudoalteromonas sp. Q18-MNA-CIBAN-0097]|uniref:EAL domain-containing protein n=1 Tax=Pseudoalteromonas sp. Q18-MNA-CIBAN-0097 TaxID=3140440 RepID=UPI00332E27B8
MGPKAKRDIGGMLRHSLFYTSVAFLFIGSLFVGLNKLLPFDDSSHTINLPLNSMFLLAFTALSLVAIIRKHTTLLASSLSIMVTILFLSAPTFTNKLIADFTMSWLQFFSWVIVLVGLLSGYKKHNPFFRKCCLASFTVLATIIVLLLFTNTGSLGSLQFASNSPEFLKTAIFLLFSAIAGLSIPSSSRNYVKNNSCSLESWLALLLTAFTILLWLNFMHQLEVANQKITKETVSKIQQQTEQIIKEQESLMQRLGDRIAATDFIYSPEQMNLDLSTYLRDFSYLDYISILNSSGNVHYSAAQTPAVKQWYNDYVATESVLLPENRDREYYQNAHFHYNEQADHTLFSLPLRQPNAFGLSAIVAGINFQQVMQSTIPLIVPTGYAITLAYEKNKEFLLSQLDPTRQYFLLGEYTVSNSQSEMNWQLHLYRDLDIGLDYVQQVSEVILIAGWLACFLVMLSQQYQQQISRQKTRLTAGNKKLRNSLELQKKLQTHHLQFMDNSADLLFIVDADGKLLEVSRSSLIILDYAAEELEGQMFMDFVHPDDLQVTEREVQSILEGQHTQYFRNRYVRKNGDAVHLMWSAQYVPSMQTIYAVGRDISELVKTESYQQAQQQILQLISVEASLDEILKQICLMAQARYPAIKACVMLKVDQQLQLASAPSLSNQYHLALANLDIAGNVGSCGTAAFQNKLVITEDIASDANWQNYSEAALAEHVLACWSLPMVTKEDNVLGTFAFYCKEARAPSLEELELLRSCSRFAANAIERAEQKRLVSESEQRFRSLYQFNPDPVYVIDKYGYFKTMNSPGCELLLRSLSELQQMHFADVISKEQRSLVTKYFMDALAGNSERFETSIISGDGSQHELHVTIIPTWIDGNVEGVIGIAKDITQRLKTEEQLQLFKRAVDASSNGVLITDITQDDMPISYVNYGFEKLTGYSRAEIEGKNCRFLQGKERDEIVTSQIRNAIAAKQEVSVVLKNYRKDGSGFWNSLFLSPVPNDDGVITHYIGIQTDISGQKNYEEELAFNASHDLLTGLPNRRLLHDRLSQSIKISARHQEKVAILFIDLDGFKLINDSLGHLIGDEVICKISTQINKQIRSGDTLARMGGDEFVLMLPDLNDLNQLAAMAEQILSVISIPFSINDKELQLTASIGISVLEENMHEPMDLIKRADLAMQRAKQLGRNNIQYYSADMEQTLNKRLNLRVMLKQAIANQEFELYYQPQVAADNGRIIGLEALLRWQHPELGFIGPDEFIPIAEEMGLIVEIGQWVIEQAASYNRSLQQRGLAEVIMAVNLSSLQFQRAGFVEQLEATLNQAQLEPKWFELELTESLLLENIEQVIDKLKHLKQLGISIAIDDFGTGYSSLNYLKRLPIDKLKIDKSFIRELVTDQKDAAITRAIIAMGHQLGLKVIAEGVETLSQANLLNKHSCDELQGYFYAKPLPKDRLESFLEQYSPIYDLETDARLPSLLLVDDEENILHSLKRVLRKEPFNIFTCNSAAEAFNLLALHNIQVIVSDQRMPEMSGTDFLKKVKEMYPDTIRMVLSGYTDLRSVTDAINKGAIYKFLTKPWHDEELKKEILSAFRMYKQRRNKSNQADY